MTSATDLLAREDREPTLHEIEPGRTGGCKVKMKTGTLGQPPVDRGRLVRRVVVQDKMDIERRGNLLVDDGEELFELDGAMTLITLTDHLSRLDIEGGEKRCGPVSAVVVCATLGKTGAQGKDRLGAIERLDLRFLVHAQHQGSVRRVHVEPDNVAHLVDKQWICRELERFRAMRLKRKRSPNARDRRLGQTGGFGHRPRAPVRGMRWRAFEGERNHSFDILIGHLSWRPGPRFVQQTVEATSEEALSPIADDALGHADPLSDFGVAHAGRAQHNDARSSSQGVRSLSTPHPLFKAASFGWAQSQGFELRSSTHAVPPFKSLPCIRRAAHNVTQINDSVH